MQRSAHSAERGCEYYNEPLRLGWGRTVRGCLGSVRCTSDGAASKLPFSMRNDSWRRSFVSPEDLRVLKCAFAMCVWRIDEARDLKIRLFCPRPCPFLPSACRYSLVSVERARRTEEQNVRLTLTDEVVCRSQKRGREWSGCI